MKLSPRIAQKVKDAATELYKRKTFDAYEADLQATVCIVSSLVDVLQQEYNFQLPIELQAKQVYEPID